MRVVVLGGTAEGRVLAAELLARGCEVVSSLAGRITRPVLPQGRVRVGGFGAVDGLVEYLRSEAPDAVVDATHPFAQTMSAHAVEAAAAAGVRLIALRRPGWSPEAGDRWIGVPDIAAAAEQAARIPGDGCVFVTTGRRGVEAFAHDEHHRYLIRMVDPPTETLPPRHTVVLDRGPYTLEGETALMEEHRVCALVTKNSGGEATAAKLVAAQHRAIPVIMVDPPAPAAGIESAGTVTEVVGLLGIGAG